MPKKKKEKKRNSVMPIEAVPQLYNRLILDWLQTFYEALKEIHETLERIEGSLKEK